MAAAAEKKTASTHRAALVHGTHTFDILGYGDLKALGRRDDGVASGTFRVGGRDWNVVCRFDGRLTDVSLELAEQEDADGYVDYQHTVTAMVSLSIDDPTGGRKPINLVGSAASEETTVVFTHNCRSYTVGVPEAFHRHEARYVKDGRLRIRCAVRVLVEEPAESSSPATSCPVPPPDITGFLRALLDSGHRADVTFAVERSRRFDAHRLVLAARSPVFRAKFFGGSRDSSLAWFRVHDVSAAAFRAVLHFIYTDELLDDEAGDGEAAAAVEDLLVAADLYGLDRLRRMCERTLWERARADAGVGSAVETLALVNGRDDCRQLQDLCIGLVADAWAADWEAATATDKYRGLKATCPTLLSSVLESVVTKQLLLHGHGHGRLLPAAPSSTTPTEKSASVYTPWQVWRGAHRLTVLGHSVVRRTHGSGEFVRSGAVELGGREWRVLYYPSGYGDDDDGLHVSGHVAVLLQLQTPLDPGVVLEASGTIVVGGSSSKKKQAHNFGHRYTHDEPSGGCQKLWTSHLVGPDDSLRVECRFEFHEVVVGNKTTGPTRSARARLVAQEQDMVVPPPSIAWHLERLLETAVGWDVTFSEEGAVFRAHTLVLSERAPALILPKDKALAAAAGKGKKKKASDVKTPTPTICVDGIKPVVFKAVLHFAYTDDLPPLDDLVRAAGTPPTASGRTRVAGELLAAAERYHLVDRMRPLCESLLCEALTPENAAATLEVARRHGRAELRAFCLDYMTSPGVFKAVVASEGYQALPADAVRDIVEHLAH